MREFSCIPKSFLFYYCLLSRFVFFRTRRERPRQKRFYKTIKKLNRIGTYVYNNTYTECMHDFYFYSYYYLTSFVRIWTYFDSVRRFFGHGPLDAPRKVDCPKCIIYVHYNVVFLAGIYYLHKNTRALIADVLRKER